MSSLWEIYSIPQQTSPRLSLPVEEALPNVWIKSSLLHFQPVSSCSGQCHCGERISSLLFAATFMNLQISEQFCSLRSLLAGTVLWFFILVKAFPSATQFFLFQVRMTQIDTQVQWRSTFGWPKELMSLENFPLQTWYHQSSCYSGNFLHPYFSLPTLNLAFILEGWSLEEY